MSKNTKTLSQAEIDSLVQQATAKRRARPIDKTPVTSQPVTPTAVAAVQAQSKRTDSAAQEALQAVIDGLNERLKKIEDAMGEYGNQGQSLQELMTANQEAQGTVENLTDRLGKLEHSMGQLELKGNACCDNETTGKPDKVLSGRAYGHYAHGFCPPSQLFDKDVVDLIGVLALQMDCLTKLGIPVPNVKVD